MEYHEASDFLFGLRRFGQQPGTESAADLLASLDDPHADTAFVQIAGSNGKGSTARMLERALREAGCSVGLFTSPHLEDLRERIRVDGREIPEREVTRFVEATREYVRDRGAEGASPTFFEATTAMALWHFAREDVDVAVLEAGIGGRLDATSVVDPIASAVTTVSLEHTDVLGETAAEIARDMAHVAPADRPPVTAATGDALAAIRDVAGDAITVRCERDGHSEREGSDHDEREEDDADEPPDVLARYGGRVNHTEAAIELEGEGWSVDTRLPVLGAHQAENAGIAAALARQVADDRGIDLSERDLERGFRQAHWPGRFEVLSTEPLIVLDGAHNAAACGRLAEVLDEFDYDDLHLVFGAMHDKPHGEMATALPRGVVRTCRPDTGRAEDPAVLARVFERTDSTVANAGGSVASAVSDAIAAAEPDDCVLVTGSLYVVAEARARWTRLQTPKRIESLADARETLSTAGVAVDEVWDVRDEMVHRVVETRLQRRQAELLRRHLLSLGGDCAIASLHRGGERVRVVLSGTLGEFRDLAAALDAEPYGLPRVGAELRELLGIEVPEPEPRYPWEDGATIMGILNITPDSFHDGGEYNRVEDARERAERMIEAGVGILDVGGESTRPGAEPVTIADEIERVVPVIEALADLEAPISIDTRKAAVAEAALAAGADIINDVSGLEDPEMRFVAAEHDAPLVVMHSIETPVDPSTEIEYDDVVRDTIEQLRERVLLAEKAGLDRDQIVVDPGVGFGKTAAESFELLDRLDEFRALGCPVLVGHSHKSMFEYAGYDADERLEPTVAATALAVDRGADVIRVHDVPENVAAVRVAEAARESGRGG